jgi:hypothetical protein
MLWKAAVAGAATLALSLLALWMVFGRPALQIESPRPGAQIGVHGLELLVRFAPEDTVESATVRVLLNGADVTAQCTRGSNGVHGRLHGLLDGDNRVRVEVFVRTPAGLLVEQAREVEVRFRPPLGFDRG